MQSMTEHEKSVDDFIHILLHTGQDALAYNLASIFSIDVTPFIDLSKYDPASGFQIHPNDKLRESPYPPESKTRAYQFRNPGLCLLVNNYFTVGTYFEMLRFRNIFHQLGFEVRMKKNLSAQDLYLELLMISKDPELAKYDAFAFMSISHGNEDGEVYGFDRQTVKINLLTELFNNENCKHMLHPDNKKKPRMFFLNCCRGGQFNFK
jgi:hypothetical protein